MKIQVLLTVLFFLSLLAICAIPLSERDKLMRHVSAFTRLKMVYVPLSLS